MSATLPPEVTKLCDEIVVSITFSDPDQHDLPLIYVNKAFEKLTQWPSAEVLGKNCRFLQGPKSNRAVIDDLALSLHHRKGDVCCLVNYRRDGCEFLNVLSVRPIRITKTRQLLMGCQWECRTGDDQWFSTQNADAVDSAMRQLYAEKPFGAKQFGSLETYALEMIKMRFNVVFTTVQNELLAQVAAKMYAQIAAAMPVKRPTV